MPRRRRNRRVPTMSTSDVRIAIAEAKPGYQDYGAVSVVDDTNHWDYVMVFPNPPKDGVDPKFSRENIVLKLRKAGLEVKMFYSAMREMVFCKIRAPEERLKDEADVMNLRMELDPVELRRCSQSGVPEQNIKPFPIEDVKETYTYDPYEYIYAPYTQAEHAQRFFLRKSERGSLFSSTERLIIIEHIITIQHKNGARCDIEQLLYDGIIFECFPLHEEPEKTELKNKWIVWSRGPMDQPFEAIWNYFGDKVAMYFLYVGHCTQWLTYPSVVGTLVYAVELLVPRASSSEMFAYLSPAFGAFMTIWMTVYLEDWKRMSARASLIWGTSDFEEDDHLRPQFHGEVISSPIDGSPTRWYDPRKRLQRVIFSWSIISLLILVVLALVTGIFVLRYDLTKGKDSAALLWHGIPIGAMIAAFANVVQISLMGKIYYFVSIMLVNQENHRTDEEFEGSLIKKTVIFQFVNNYAALFYTAFAKSGVEGCMKSCMWELQYTYAIVYLSRLFTSNCTEVLIPRLWNLIVKFKMLHRLTQPEDPAIEARKSRAEKELFLAQYDWRGTFDDYTELVIQFGFTTMFVVAFPISPLLSYINNYFEIRLDAYRLIFESRRPRPQRVKDMGYWYNVLQAITAISICTNGGVVIFTGTYFNGISTTLRVWLFTLFISFMFFFKYILDSVIDDTPASVHAQERRNEFLVDKCIYHVPDEEYDAPQPVQSAKSVLEIADLDDDLIFAQ